MTTNDQAKVGSDKSEEKVSLETLAKMSGFPVELIKEEVFKGKNNEEISLEDLRKAMLSYIDSTMLISNQK